MQDKLKEILDKIIEWWKKFTTKQKALICSAAATVAVMLAILSYFILRPQMVDLVVCADTTEAASVQELLEGADIEYEIMEDNLTFQVNKEDETDAIFLLGTNEIVSKKYTLDDVFDGSFSQTEADKTKKYQQYLEERIAEQLANMDAIKSATVKLSIPVDDGTILAQKEDTHAALTLRLDSELEEGMAEGIARFVATAVGNDTTECITILDSQANVLFAGGEESSATGTIASQLSVKSAEESRVKNEIRGVILGTDIFDNVSVGLNLNMDFTNKTVTDHRYYVEDGREEGYLTSKDSYSQITTGGLASVPGTDSNDDTSYVIDDSNLSSSETTDDSEQYALNETITETLDKGGTINYDTSTVSVVATHYKFYNEDVLRASGELDEMSFDEFREANDARVELEVPDSYYDMVANATGFERENITIVAYEIPYFEYSSEEERGIEDYAQIAIAVLILLMLGYVVFRSTRPDSAQDMEPELSVESLLESTKSEETLEDIGFTEKSETRVLIERFVDEKPEAAAALLRNWLEEEWE